MKLEQLELTLSTGEKVWYEYDRDSDILEIIFRPAEATCAIELTESIVLRFDWETSEPLSLGFISFSRLAQPAEYGEMHFQLLADEWPNKAREKVWAMLQSFPLNEFLKLGSYAPSHTRQILPVAAVKRPRMMATAVQV